MKNFLAGLGIAALTKVAALVASFIALALGADDYTQGLWGGVVGAICCCVLLLVVFPGAFWEESEDEAAK